jgi:hypothetical protein
MAVIKEPKQERKNTAIIDITIVPLQIDDITSFLAPCLIYAHTLKCDVTL